MLIEYDRFSIASHYVTAIEYGDYSGIEAVEEIALNEFLDSLPQGYKYWQWSNDQQFAVDSVTGSMADCLEGVLFMDSNQL
jgi:hypothetical protein